MICKIAKFYPAYKIDDLASVPRRTLSAMWECMTIIEAQDQLKLFTALDWPNMKKAQRQKLHRELHRLAYPSNIQAKKFISVADLQNVLGR